MLGVIRWVVAEHHFAKIAADRKIFFAHYDDRAVPFDFDVGMWVDFDPIEASRGPRAINIRPYGVGPRRLEASAPAAEDHR
jgi:hypothetical protein